jgi:hypothetical protein
MKEIFTDDELEIIASLVTDCLNFTSSCYDDEKLEKLLQKIYQLQK